MVQLRTVAVGVLRFDVLVEEPAGALRELREWLVTHPKRYNFVILQEQSQIPGFWGTNSPEFNESLTACIGLDKLVQKITNAQTMFFLTWGRRLRDDRNPDIYPVERVLQRTKPGCSDWQTCAASVVSARRVLSVDSSRKLYNARTRKPTG